MESLQPFQDTIPLRHLPANFRDAISITQQLGIQYLWIDSLCIIQDSKDDWEAESKNMRYIYREVVVTIAASASGRSTDGILRNYPGSKKDEEVVSLRLLPERNLDGIVHVSLKEEDGECLRMLSNVGPLSSRGWTREYLKFSVPKFSLYQSLESLECADISWARRL